MRYLLAFLLPPLAVLLCGKPFQAILNCALTLCFYLPGLLHALFVVSSTMAVGGGERLYQYGGQNRASLEGGNERKYLGLFSVTVLPATRKVDENWPPQWSNFCPPPTG